MNSTVTKENIPCQYFYIFNSHLSSGAGGFADKMKTNPSSCDYLMLDLSKHKNMIFWILVQTKQNKGETKLSYKKPWQ